MGLWVSYFSLTQNRKQKKKEKKKQENVATFQLQLYGPKSVA